jgi:RimJ/RimL family protein N-acetyltransferase
MKKLKAKPEPKLVQAEPNRTAVYHQGGTNRAIAQLRTATHDLSMRRARDMLPGKIATRRLVLRAPIRGDVPDLVRLADNKAIADKLATMPHPYTRADAVGFVEILCQRPDERIYAVTLGDRLIGSIGLSFAEGKPPDLGYWLGESHWGKGYMTEAVRGLIEAAHRTPGFELITAKALADNAASLHVLEKAGFKRTGKGKGEIGNVMGKPIIKLELKRPRWM